MVKARWIAVTESHLAPDAERLIRKNAAPFGGAAFAGNIVQIIHRVGLVPVVALHMFMRLHMLLHFF
jgi:hypothetical protein